jgi:hypothetical protein
MDFRDVYPGTESGFFSIPDPTATKKGEGKNKKTCSNKFKKIEII